MARVGSFQGPSGAYGVPPASVHPEDNQIKADPTLAEAEALKSQADELFEDLNNVLRAEQPKR